jgi:hypothetical protein
MKRALVFFCYGNSKYFTLVKNLISNFKHFENFQIIVYTENPDEFLDYKVITIKYESDVFSYHHKIRSIKEAWDLGFDEILFLDSDLIVNDESLFSEILKIKFSPGVSYTRNGQISNLNAYLYHKESYRNKLSHLGLDFKAIPSVFEDLLYFNFKDIERERIGYFFDLYESISSLKHEYDIECNYHRYGDHEGYTLAMSAIKLDIPVSINPEFLDSVKLLRAMNYTYDGIMKTIISEIDFIFPYRRDSEEREKNILTILNYYRRHFPDNRFIISEQGLEKSNFQQFGTHIFERKDLPHNQSKCINSGVIESDKRIICVVDSDVILINHYCIYMAARDIYLGECEYVIPYTECVDLPDFDFRRPWGRLCIGGIFIIDREKFISMGMNDESFEGWGREDDARHEKLIGSGVEFRRYNGNIVHLWHPPQKSKGSSAETNMGILNKIRDGISNSN